MGTCGVLVTVSAKAAGESAESGRGSRSPCLDWARARLLVVQFHEKHHILPGSGRRTHPVTTTITILTVNARCLGAMQPRDARHCHTHGPLLPSLHYPLTQTEAGQCLALPTCDQTKTY